MQWDETEKQARSTRMCGPSATTRRKARRASQPNAGARHHCLSTRMCELVPARIRREAQGIGAAGAAPTCARLKAFWVFRQAEMSLAGRRPVEASASIQCTRLGATHSSEREGYGERLRFAMTDCSEHPL